MSIFYMIGQFDQLKNLVGCKKNISMRFGIQVIKLKEKLFPT